MTVCLCIRLPSHHFFAHLFCVKVRGIAIASQTVPPLTVLYLMVLHNIPVPVRLVRYVTATDVHRVL
jgi:hypothetical protein